MTAYWVEWLNLLGRWLHFIVGIAWIGSSFYFVWLDNHLEAPEDEADTRNGVGGELWSVHGGGFYHAQKYAVAPPQLPATLHWFKWEAYTTWLSGMFLLALIYWYGASVYLVDPAVAEIAPAVAVAIGIACIIGGWIIYDLVCRSPLGGNAIILGVVIFGLLTIAAWALCQWFSGRGAYIHFGALLGTIMVGNVFFIIIPGQKRMVAAYAAGAPVNPADGIRAKQRSVHNTYFTLPLLFVMISNHYAMTYAHAYNWLILIGMTVAGALIRVYFVARHSGRASPLPLIGAVLTLAAIALAISPKPRASASDAATSGDVVGTPTFAEVVSIVRERCAGCHAAVPTQPGFLTAPGGILLEDAPDILRQAEAIYQQSVVTRAMPIGNLTGMLDAERDALARWFEAGAKGVE